MPPPRRVLAPTEALPPAVASVLEPADLETLRERLMKLPEPPALARLEGADWRGAVAVFLLVFAATFPVAVPFIFLQDAALAMRVSNAVAVTLLFASGFMYARYAGRSPWAFGLSMVGLGLALVALTIALGG